MKILTKEGQNVRCKSIKAYRKVKPEKIKEQEGYLKTLRRSKF